MPWPLFWKGGAAARTNVTRTMSDSLTLSGSSVVRRTVRIVSAASISLSDNLALTEQGPVTRSMADSLTLAASSVVRRTVRIVRAAAIAFADALGLTEQGPITRSMADSLTLSASSVVRRIRTIASSASIAFADDLSLVEDDQTPAAPSGLNAQESVSSPPDVDLTWTDNADNEDNYQVERRDYPGPTAWNILTQTLPANTTSYTDTTTASETEYDYRVRARNSRGVSGPSNVANITTGGEA